MNCVMVKLNMAVRMLNWVGYVNDSVSSYVRCYVNGLPRCLYELLLMNAAGLSWLKYLEC